MYRRMSEETEMVLSNAYFDLLNHFLSSSLGGSELRDAITNIVEREEDRGMEHIEDGRGYMVGYNSHGEPMPMPQNEDEVYTSTGTLVGVSASNEAMPSTTATATAQRAMELGASTGAVFDFVVSDEEFPPTRSYGIHMGASATMRKERREKAAKIMSEVNGIRTAPDAVTWTLGSSMSFNDGTILPF